MADSLTARFFNQVDRLSQERGRRYFLRGAVSYIEGGALSVHAGVQGTRLYDVDVSIEKHLISASCTCPAFEREFDPCKHIWAALLAAEQSGFLAALNNIPAPHLRGVAPKPPPKKISAARRHAKHLVEASWKQQLHQPAHSARGRRRTDGFPRQRGARLALFYRCRRDGGEQRVGAASGSHRTPYGWQLGQAQAQKVEPPGR